MMNRWMILLAVVLVAGMAPRVFAADIAGAVLDAQGKPVASAHVTVKDSKGNIVGEADSDSAGRYRITGVSPGAYTVVLSPKPGEFLGQTVQSSLGAEGLCLNWATSSNTPALGTARPGATLGACAVGISPVVIGAGAAALITGGVVGGLGAAGGFGGGGGGPGSPEM